MNDRALAIKNIILEYGQPIEEWPDEAWEDVEECICGVYWEEWKDLIDPVLIIERELDGE